MARPPATVVEDYLKAIYAHTEWQDEPVTPSRLAERLGLAPSTVTEMVKKLAAQGLVDHARYGAIRLTESGRREALRMLRRHRVIETWLVERCGYAWHEVHDEAEVLEHAMSDRLLDELDRQLGHPRADPHGDPIPDAEGRVDRPDAVLLAELSGGRALVARVSDRDPETLRELTRGGVAPGTVVSAGALAAVATAIWVIPLDD